MLEIVSGDTSFYLYTSLLLIFGFILSIPLKRKGLPVSIAYLLSGILLSLILKIPTETMSFLKGVEELAIVLLFFDIGYELNIDRIKEIVGFPLLLALMEVVIALLMSLGLGILLNMGLTSILILGFASSFSSTVFTYKLIEERRVSRESVKELIYRVVIVEDILLIIVLGLIESINKPTYTLLSLIAPVTFPLILFTISYWFTHNFLRQYISRDESGIVIVIAYGLMLSYISIIAGSSPAIGAFIAGLSFSGTHRELVEDIKRINSFALLLFFVSLGMSITSYNISTGIFIQAILLSLLMVFIHTLSTITSSMLMSGHSILYGLETGFYLSTLSELGLLIAYKALQYGLVGSDIALAIPLAVVIASFTSAYLVSRKIRIIVSIYRSIPRGLRETINTLTLSIHGRVSSKRYKLLIELLHSLLHLFGELILIFFLMAIIADYIYILTSNLAAEAVFILSTYIAVIYWALKRSFRISDKIIQYTTLKVTGQLLSKTHRFLALLITILSLITGLLTIIIFNYESLTIAMGGITLYLAGALLFLAPIILVVILYIAEK